MVRPVSASRSRTHEVLAIILVTIAVLVGWCTAYHRWSPRDWTVPVGYTWDDLFVFGTVKAHAEGSLGVFGTKVVPRLNAPSIANWNDFPITEDLMFHSVGVLARAVGVFAAANLAFCFCALAAAWSFYASARWLGYARMIAAAGAVAYGLPAMMFQRGVGHLVLMSFWFIPLLWAALEKLRDDRRSPRAGRWAVTGAGAGVIVALLAMEYYVWMACQLLILAALALALNRQPRRALIALAWAGGLALGGLLGNCDTLFYAARHGWNRLAVARSLNGLTLNALQLPSLLLPPVNHRVAAWADWSRVNFYQGNVIAAEGSTPYLGLLGIAGLGLLVWQGSRALLAPRRWSVPAAFAATLWVLAYSVPGGINELVGLGGIQVFRDTNRYSIFVNALTLLFLARFISRRCPRRYLIPVGLVLIAIAVLDQTPSAADADTVATTRKLVESDRNLVERLEARLPPRSMVFELPVVAFPESPPLNRMSDYEQLIPYFNSRSLRWSYGTVKGRGDEAWQHATESMPPPQMADALARNGFAAIWIDRRGYADNGDGLLAALRPDREVWLSDDGDRAVVLLRPTGQALPALGIILDEGMYGWESDPATGTYWTWVAQHGQWLLFNGADQPRTVEISLQLRSLRPQTAHISAPGYQADFDLAGGGPTEATFKLTLPPGQTVIEFSASNPAERPSNGDPRTIAFGIYEAKIDGHRP